MSSSEWKKYQLNEVLEIKYGKDHKHLLDGNIPVYGSGGIMRYANTSLYEKESILIPRKGTLSNLFFIDVPFWSVDTMFYTKIKNGNNAKFLFYQLKTLNLASMNVGSAVPSLTTEILNEVEISLPNLYIQNRIASILSSLDDKIELNRQTNKTLEAIAQTLFKEMCLPKGEELPEGWRVGRLGEVVDINMGQSPSGTSYNQVGEGIIFFQGKAEFGFRFPAIDKYTTEPKKYANKFDSLLSVRAPVGTINMATEKCCIGRGLAAISGKNNCWSFAFYLLKSLSIRFEMYNGEGTVFGSINKSDLESIEIVIPPKDIIEGFNAIGRSIDEFIYINEQESQTLAAIRDSLLPKLMKGEIELNLLSL